MLVSRPNRFGRTAKFGKLDLAVQKNHKYATVKFGKHNLAVRIMSSFFGRENELETLKNLKSVGKSRFVAIKGRRRIGKSRLISEFSKSFQKHLSFTGIPPSRGVTSQDLREVFVQQMIIQGFPNIKADDWSEVFYALSQEAKKGAVLVSLDEIAWMGSKDPAFLGKLKIAWDQMFSKNTRLVLVVASSISSWIEKNILNSTGFFGRIDLTLTLEELEIKDCVKFWGSRQANVSAQEKLRILGVTGGIPKYLELINPKVSAEENIRQLCFMKSGFLFNEFERIFHDLFSKRSEIYKKIVEELSKHRSMSQREISNAISIKLGR